MRLILASFIILMLPLATQAAMVTVTPKVLQKGIWRLDGCKTDEFTSCLCEADITYIELAGIPNAEAINADILKRAKEASYGMGESDTNSAACTGTKLKTIKKELPNHDQYTFETKVAFENDALLDLSIDGWWYGQGAAHGNPWSDSIIIDKVTGRELKQGDIIAAKDIPAVNAYIYKTLKTMDSTFLSSCEGSDDKYGTCPSKPEDYLGDKPMGSLSVDKDGLSIDFSVYAVGPYSSGGISVPIPAKFISNPAIKQLSKKAAA